MNYEFQVFQALDHHKQLINEFEQERKIRAALKIQSRDHNLVQYLLARIGKVLILAGNKLEQLDHQNHHSQNEPQTA
jgi:hypothetical protein